MEHYLSSLQRAIRKYWNKKALNTYRGESFSYGDMATAIEKFHVLFELCGIRKGEKVAICAKNSAKWGAAYLASNTYGTVTVPILPDFLPDSVMSLTDHSESTVLFVNRSVWDKTDISKMPKLRLVIEAESWELLYAADEKIETAFADYPQVFAARFPDGFGPEDVNYPTDNWDELSTINYTSGSTGNPKGVMLSYRNFSSVVDYSQRYMEATDKDSMVSMLPMAHMYGLVIEFIYPLCNGTDIYWLGKKPTPTLLLQAFSDVKPYLMITVPLVMEKIFKSKIKPVVERPLIRFLSAIPGINKLIFKKIRVGLEQAFGGNVQEFILGGAAVNPDVEKWFKRIGFPYMVGYGMTEATPLIAYECHEKFVAGSCGKAIDCNDVRIDSEDPQHVVGEIQVKGDNICMGYYKNPEATANLFTEDGYLRTGDLGIIDAEGNIFIKGRSKNLILRADGQNIYPEEIEAVVNNQDFVVESVVVDRGGRLVALVYLDEQALSRLSKERIEAVPDGILSGANRKLSAFCRLAEVEVRKEPFEKTPKLSIKRFLYS